MTTGSANPRGGLAAPAPRRERTSGVGVTQPRVLASEWIKLRGLRSTPWALVGIAVAIVGGGSFVAVGIVVQDASPAGEAVAADPSGGALTGVGLAQLAAVALGVLAVTTEFPNRGIRTSLTAVPARLPLIWGKAAVVAVLVAAASLPALALTFVVADAVIGIDDVSISLTSPGVARAMVGAGLGLVMTAVLSSGLGWLLRSTAGAVSIMLAVLYLLPSVAAVLAPPVAAYLPSNAAAAATQVQLSPNLLPPWAGLAVLGGYATLSLAAAARDLRRRDA